MRWKVSMLIDKAIQKKVSEQATRAKAKTREKAAIWSSNSGNADPVDMEAYQGYVESYGQTLNPGTQIETNPQEMDRRLARPRPKDVGVKDALGFGLLHYAVERDLKGTVSQLLRLRADPNVENCLLRTPLHFAVIQDDPDIVSELLTYGANPNHMDVEGWTPLHFAIHLNHIKCLTVLMGYNPDIHSTNSSGKTPLDYAKDDKMRSFVTDFETDRVDKTQDSMDTTDASHENAPSKISRTSFSICKHDPSDAWGRQDRSNSGNGHELRAQRPNEESGAIAVPHPKSAYS